ncbi:hypothetical protein [Acidovorax delafieldii]|uniref:hypothetical protein n=1 Tax=Acidovorax delafieldii TaxID=47920 RepID=UPI003ECD5608
MSLKDFPLSWRWTDEKYTPIPLDVLLRIEPLEFALSDALFEQSLAFNGTDGLNQSLFSIKCLETSDIDPIHATNWLLTCHDDKETRVFLSWGPRTAISTTWGIFAHYWDSFCYPASDDLTVWSESLDWVFAYQHRELMQFGKRQKLDSP